MDLQGWITLVGLRDKGCEGGEEDLEEVVDLPVLLFIVGHRACLRVKARGKSFWRDDKT